MSMTIEEVFAARRSKIDAAKNKKSPLHARLGEIVTLLNGGSLWVDILEYLEANDVRTGAGTPISRSPLIDWCSKNVPAYDEAVGTPADVIAGRKVSLAGANRSTRNAIAKRTGLVPAAAARAPVPAAPFQTPAAASISAQAALPKAPGPFGRNPAFGNPVPAKPASDTLPSPERVTEMIARMREEDDKAAMNKIAGRD